MKTSKIKRGDTVRFLNAVGGGVVTRVDEQKNMVYVEDQDGFEIPVLERECVAVPKVNETTNFPVRDFSSKSASKESAVAAPVKPDPKETPQAIEVYETAEGDQLKALLAIVPVDIKNLHNSTFDCLLINDSNYFLFYNIIIGNEGQRRSAASGILEPNIQEDLFNINNEQLNDWENLRVQLVAFKQNKHYQDQPAIDRQFHISPLKFYKLHTYSENEYFDEPSWLIDLAEKAPSKMPEISAEEIKKALYQKESQEAPKHTRHKVSLNPTILEVDLHINELVDTTAGMSNADMLQLQIEKFHAIIDQNKHKKGQKIVFIHGKGEGVLRNEILRLLKSRYKSYYFQDASFREYGFGATMVVIK